MAKKKKEIPITGITVSKEDDFSAWYTELINVKLKITLCMS